ncbi:unnamed protein product [Arabis nemorensis]|uniref:Uncharacterized protein n=1 Tax=Arabis nemorensis TaxID=586526 RepID=A0A565BNS9_9BRAS|nr:unnamed protein product [Arabis nemorensis]
METLEQDAYNTIAGLASRLNINEDKATLLLLSFKWDEEKIILAVSEHLVNAALSTYFVNRPHFDNKRVSLYVAFCAKFGKVAKMLDASITSVTTA